MTLFEKIRNNKYSRLSLLLSSLATTSLSAGDLFHRASARYGRTNKNNYTQVGVQYNPRYKYREGVTFGADENGVFINYRNNGWNLTYANRSQRKEDDPLLRVGVSDVLNLVRPYVLAESDEKVTIDRHVKRPSGYDQELLIYLTNGKRLSVNLKNGNTMSQSSIDNMYSDIDEAISDE